MFFTVPAPIFRLLFLLLLMCTGLWGCAGKDTSENIDEFVKAYAPIDDGKPLTPQELKAFNSTGDLDKNLSQKDKEVVELHFKFFVHKNRQTLERFIERSARFLPYAEKIFKERGLPHDLVYLFMVESGGNPKAYSSAKATGLWQFMPFTGKKYGLTQNKWIDERRDPFKSTFAASDYLLKLYSDFKNWHLAAAAYNAGEGKIGRALSGTQALDFFELCRQDHILEISQQLKQETKQYVPRILALAKIMRNLPALGFAEPSKAASLMPIAVSIPPKTNLRQLARGAGLTWEGFNVMNSAFLQKTSPPSATSTAYFTEQHVTLAKNWLDSDKRKMYASWQEYTIKKGDSLHSISRSANASVDALRHANDFVNLPRVGDTMLVPPKLKKVATAQKIASTGYYIVKQGDSLFSIARQHKISVQQLCAFNNIDPKANLRIGQQLKITANPSTTGSTTPKPASTASSKSATTTIKAQKAPATAPSTAGSQKPTNTTVRAGDTLYSIAKKYNVSVSALQKANGLSNKSTIKVGQKIRIP